MAVQALRACTARRLLLLRLALRRRGARPALCLALLAIVLIVLELAGRPLAL